MEKNQLLISAKFYLSDWYILNIDDVRVEMEDTPKLLEAIITPAMFSMIASILFGMLIETARRINAHFAPVSF